MASFGDAFSGFLSHPISALETIFTPSTSTQELANERVQAFGINPNTGQPFVSNVSNAVDNGYDPSNPSGFISLVQQQVSDQYAADYAQAFNSIPLYPSFSDLLSGGSAISVIFIAVIVFVFILFLLKVQ